MRQMFKKKTNDDDAFDWLAPFISHHDHQHGHHHPTSVLEEPVAVVFGKVIQYAFYSFYI